MNVLRRFLRGRKTDPAWVRPLLLTLLGATALLYIVGLGRSGWANAFYSAAAQAGASSWKALFFGASDAASFITVDKPPLSLWVMGISARLFGVNAWSILVPQALMGVAAVGALYATVRRWASPAAGLLAGAALALTPVATLMFRFNNPDALLVLLLTLAAYTLVRALEHGSARWLALTGALIGCGFMTKMLQAFLVVPVFVLVYLIAAPTPLRRRLVHLVVAGAALVVSAGWWVAAVELWPKSSRPYIGGSQTNSVLELIFGYNGLGRITGNETGSVVPGGGTGGGGAWGPTGIWRMFNASWGGQIAWLLPAALVFIVVLLWLSRREPRTGKMRTATLLWGGTLLVTLIVFSLGKGIIHEYYAVALAPPIAALVGIGADALWKAREWLAARLTLAAIVLGTSIWAYVLLDRSADWYPWLRFAVVAGGVIAAVSIAVGERAGRRLALAGALTGVAVALAAPTAYSLQTAATNHSGSLPTAGPTVADSRGGPGGAGGNFAGGGFPGGGNFAGGGPGGATGGGMPGGAPPATTASQNGGTPPSAGSGDGAPPSGNAPSGYGSPGSTGGPGGGGAGGSLLDASTPNSELVATLQKDSGDYTWVAATVGAQSAAGYQLATGDPVMSLGGFNGSDPYPTLAQFKALITAGRVHYYIGSGSGGGPGSAGGSSMSAISSWVSENYSSKTVGGVTLYDLTSPTSATTSN
jgi:4-amino-4-deoxy-L-arabinose transferase-like glycosyltransferase